MRRPLSVLLCAALTPLGVVTLAPPSGAATERVVLADGFEYGLGGWATEHTGVSGLPDWGRVGSAASGSFAAHVVGAGAVSDQVMVSEALALGAAPVVSFRHRYDFEVDAEDPSVFYDGGAVEVSTDGGDTWQDLADVADDAADLGYDGTLFDSVDHPDEVSPLAGREAFTGLLADWTPVQVPVGALAGETIRLRFRLGADVAVASGGWWVDDVAVTDGSAAPLPVASAPTRVRVTRAAADTLTVSFNRATPAGGRAVVAHRATCTSPDAPSRSAVTRDTEVEVSGLTRTAAYSCRVRAWTTAGEGVASTAVKVGTTVAGAAAAPRAASVAASPDPLTSEPAGGGDDQRDVPEGDFDALAGSDVEVAPSVTQRAAIEDLADADAPLQVQSQLGVPTTLLVADPEPAGRSRSGSSASARRAVVDAARDHLGRIAGAYRLDGADVAAVDVTGVQDLGGPVVVELGQDVDGVEVWNERLSLALDADLGLVGAAGYLLPAEVRQRDFDLDAEAAAQAAYDDLAGADATRLRSTGEEAGYVLLAGDGATARARRVMYRLPDGLVAAWYVEVFADGGGTAYVIDAGDGSLLHRNDLTSDAEEYDYRVWADGDGVPYAGPYGTDGFPHPTGVPDAFRAAAVAPSLVAGPTTGDPWLPEGATVTSGNNVDAYADVSGADGFDASDYRAGVTAPGTFDRTYDVTKAAGADRAQADAGLTSLFYTINHLHDWFYDSGFDEAAGNAQADNYGRGGDGGDAIRAEGLDFSGRNNANMMTPADGVSPRMQMYVWDGPVDGGLSVPATGTSYNTGNSTSFGPQAYDVTARVVPAVDGVGPTGDGCEPLVTDVAGAIALVDRGTCSFYVKAQRAQTAGAVGLLIVDNSGGAIPPTLGGSCTGSPCPITVPTASVTTAVGAALRAAPPASARLYRTAAGVARDGSVDAQVVAHEWGHYLTHRLVPSLSSVQARSMGEGWGDFVALLMTVRPENVADLDAAYSVGAFATAVLSTSPSYFGIRRMPYSTDPSINGLSLRHISDGQALPSVPLINLPPNSEVHNAGEVWASMLWDCYASLLERTTGDDPELTFAQAKRRMTDYLVASLKLTPAEPTFLEARDALLMAARAVDVTDYERFVEAFAGRGAGVGAVAPERSSSTLQGVVESYDGEAAPPTASVDLAGGTEGDAGWYRAAPVAAASVLSNFVTNGVRCALDDPTHADHDEVFLDEREPCDYAGQGATMPEGVHTLYAAGEDLVGDLTGVAARTVKVDSIAPELECLPTTLPVDPAGGEVTARVLDDGSGPAAATVSAAADTSAEGTFSVTVQGRDVAGNTAEASCSYTVDGTAPGAASLAALPTFTTDPAVTLRASASDDGSGLGGYVVERRMASYRAKGLPARWSEVGEADAAGRFRATGLKGGTTYCFRVRARDLAGNLGPASAQRCTARVLDDGALGRSAGWTSVRAKGYAGGKAAQATSKGRILTLEKLHATRLALWARTCSACGSVQVKVGAKRIATVSLRSSKTRAVASVTVKVPRRLSGTLRLVTTSKKQVVIDGIGASQE
ncbi:hypothetical protein E8D34_10595 [Nocardioides sp. GY 10113]|uniref:M36 family metallopeptidase n=1 Tax=Nocardioides sp. GY 10113 TaxID=2569761 RepID=UPI0010A8E433|nr:M36 family metallopeptidase [Nocardioides sp. GY 10113]TIC87553.1 hypothetical protein E8D34_10595 [Nocardioides sp. GY 10113]